MNSVIVTDNKKTVLLLGASGLTGSLLLKHLIAKENVAMVITLSRRKIGIDSKKVREVVVDLNKFTAADLPEVNGKGIKIDAICSCLGTTIGKAGSQETFYRWEVEYPLHVAQQVKRFGCDHYLYVSAAGSNPDARFYYPRVRGEQELVMEQQGFKRLDIMQPSFLLGKRREVRVGEKIVEYLFAPFAPLLPQRLAHFRPVAADDVAAAMASLLDETTPGVYRHRYEGIIRYAGR